MTNWFTKQSTRNKIIIIVLGVVGLGMIFPPPTTNWWTDTITGQIAYIPFKVIYDSVSQQAVSTLQCIDERDGSVAGYSAFDAQTGKITCT